MITRKEIRKHFVDKGNMAHYRACEKNGLIATIEEAMSRINKKTTQIYFSGENGYTGIYVRGKLTDGRRHYTSKAQTLEEGVEALLKAFYPANPQNPQTYEKRRLIIN